MKTPQGPVFLPRAFALSQIGLPFLLQTGEPFMYLDVLDKMFGTEAAND